MLMSIVDLGVLKIRIVKNNIEQYFNLFKNVENQIFKDLQK